VTFIVTATGTPTLIYQWRKDGEDIPGAVAATHTIDAVTPGDAGSYDVVVTNPCGQATSDSVELTVGPPVPGDVDRDCDVDLDDHELFYGCLAGPGVSEPPQGCSPEQFTRSDLDLDDDVDLGDFLSFQQHLADR
jgi:hypothetical protein